MSKETLSLSKAVPSTEMKDEIVASLAISDAEAGPVDAVSAEAATPAAVYPDKAYVKSLVGDSLHLFTNEMITADPKKILIDGFAKSQLSAGKWAIETD